MRAIRVGVHQGGELAAQRRVEIGRRIGQRIGLGQEPVRVLHAGADLFGPRRRFANEHRSLEQFQRDVLPGGGFDPDIALPRAKAIDPRDDGVLMPAELDNVEAGRPFVVTGRDERHRGFVPL